MTQKHYRVYLYPKYNGVCLELAVMAAESNGIPNGKFTLQDLETVFKAQKIKEKWEIRDCKCTIEGHLLTIDQTENNETKCLMAIEEVQLIVTEPEEPPYILTETEY